MSSTQNVKLFDVRTVERNIQRGLITREDYLAYLKSLEDVSSRATRVQAQFVKNVLDKQEQE